MDHKKTLYLKHVKRTKMFVLLLYKRTNTTL